jgi:hypothetical protein
MEDHPMRKITKRSAAIAAAAVIAVGGGAAAFASGWLVDGNGTANATGAKVQNMNADVALNGTVFPGRLLTATAKIDNPNEFPVNITGITGGSIAAKRSGAVDTACTNALTQLGAAAITPQPPASGSSKIIAGAVDQAISMTIKISDDFPQACQDADITATFTFKGTSTV